MCVQDSMGNTLAQLLFSLPLDGLVAVWGIILPIMCLILCGSVPERESDRDYAMICKTVLPVSYTFRALKVMKIHSTPILHCSLVFNLPPDTVRLHSVLNNT